VTGSGENALGATVHPDLEDGPPGRPPAGRAATVVVALCFLAGLVLACGCGGRAGAGPTPVTGTPAPSVSAPSAPPVSHLHTVAAARAQTALTSFDRAFLVVSGLHLYYAKTTAGGRASYWRQAEMIEMAEDAYQTTGDPALEKQIVALMRGVVSSYGRHWQARTWNDDIMWMIIASLRAYELTGQTAYLDMARTNFDAVYARSLSPDLGGGLWWTTANTQKNVTTNAPAAIAACKLATDLNDPSYLTKAESLYAWLRATLYDPATGAVYDSITPPAGSGTPVVNKVALTYNQGTFIGAADLLAQATGGGTYQDDALRTLGFTKTGIAHDGVLPAETGGPNSNGGGFKGIFARWAVPFARRIQAASFEPWFKLNADAAWSHRDARGLMGADWAAPTSPGLLYAWDCSAAVVMLEEVARR
jgi:predicted alpha-1,6-mannanase (GH76 family)